MAVLPLPVSHRIMHYTYCTPNLHLAIMHSVHFVLLVVKLQMVYYKLCTKTIANDRLPYKSIHVLNIIHCILRLSN